ncbi:MAG: SRPBCC family protein [Spirochaetales bacterium]
MGKHTTMTREILIAVPQDKAWEALAQVGDICHAHPGIKSSHLTSAQTTGIGATRHCDFTMMNATAEEKVTEWTPGERVKIEVQSLTNLPGVATMSMDFHLRSDGNATVLRAVLDYTMKNPLFDLMNVLMMKKMNASVIEGVVAGHKKYLETGVQVVADTPLELDKVIVVA